jgi:hypothetical protein
VFSAVKGAHSTARGIPRQNDFRERFCTVLDGKLIVKFRSQEINE